LSVTGYLLCIYLAIITTSFEVTGRDELPESHFTLSLTLVFEKSLGTEVIIVVRFDGGFLDIEFFANPFNEFRQFL